MTFVIVSNSRQFSSTSFLVFELNADHFDGLKGTVQGVKETDVFAQNSRRDLLINDRRSRATDPTCLSLFSNLLVGNLTDTASHPRIYSLFLLTLGSRQCWTADTGTLKSWLKFNTNEGIQFDRNFDVLFWFLSNRIFVKKTRQIAKTCSSPWPKCWTRPFWMRPPMLGEAI